MVGKSPAEIEENGKTLGKISRGFFHTLFGNTPQGVRDGISVGILEKVGRLGKLGKSVGIRFPA